MTTNGSSTNPPELVRSYLARILPPEQETPATVRVRQIGEMWKKPGARSMHFTATEDFAVDRVAFSWRARFPLVGPLALTVIDEFASGDGRLRVSLLGVPLQTQRGPEIAAGEAMRYLAELAWAPQAIAANPELECSGIDQHTVEVACQVANSRVAVRWEFDEGDLVRGGEYANFEGTRVPAVGEAWWELPEGRFVYWRGRVTALEIAPGRKP